MRKFTILLRFCLVTSPLTTLRLLRALYIKLLLLPMVSLHYLGLRLLVQISRLVLPRRIMLMLLKLWLTLTMRIISLLVARLLINLVWLLLLWMARSLKFLTVNRWSYLPPTLKVLCRVKRTVLVRKRMVTRLPRVRSVRCTVRKIVLRLRCLLYRLLLISTRCWGSLRLVSKGKMVRRCRLTMLFTQTVPLNWKYRNLRMLL